MRADTRPDGRRLVAHSVRHPVDGPAPIERHDDGKKLDLVRGTGRHERTDRRLAAPAQRFHDRTLGLERGARHGVVDRLDSPTNVVVALADLDRDDALARRRQARRSGNPECDSRRQAQPAQSGSRENHGIVLAVVELAEPRVQVAADLLEACVREQAFQLCHAAHAARADDRSVSREREQLVDPIHGAAHGGGFGHHGRITQFRVGIERHVLGQDDRIERILARQHRADRQSLWQDGWHVLAAVDSHIDVAAEERVLDLLDEQPLPAGLGEGRVLQPIARRLDHDDLAGRPTGLPDAGCHLVGLPQRQRAAAGADS